MGVLMRKNDMSIKKDVKVEIVGAYNTSEYTFTDKELEYLHIFTPALKEVFRVFIDTGASKHGEFNFLRPDGRKCSRVDNSNSLFHHVAEYFTGSDADPESGKHPLAHGACRMLIGLLRYKLGIKHPDDK